LTEEKTFTVKAADWVGKLPPYLFARLDEAAAEARAGGVDVIDLGTGDPDLPTPEPIVNAMQRACAVQENHMYPSYSGSPRFRKACTDWMRNRFGVTLDPDSQILALIGAKEGVAHLVQSIVNPGDVVLATTPGYPPYFSSALMTGAQSYAMPLLAENRFLPRLDLVPEEIRRRARIMFINYPNNPTGARADLEFFKEALDFCRAYGILLAHDAAYVECYDSGDRPHSIFEVSGADEVAVELHSFSKAFNMCGWRIGFAAGNRQALKALGTVKKIIDSGPFTAVQEAAIAGLEMPEADKRALRSIYAERRKVVTDGLKAAGLEVNDTDVTIYVWARVPEGFDDASFCEKLIQSRGVVVAPGSSFGAPGKGWFRIALCSPSERLAEAVRRIGAFIERG